MEKKKGATKGLAIGLRIGMEDISETIGLYGLKKHAEKKGYTSKEILDNIKKMRNERD